jgi:DNA (cytosine-5)-methyltransferase 1
MTFKVLNLYAGLGGNRTLWENVNVTAVEYDPEIAAIYKDRFPGDKVIIGDAHKYLIENYDKFDFIWSSPPCQSHSNIRHNLGVRLGKAIPMYPDLTLYQEILFLKHHFKGKWIVENVKPYYTYLIPPTAFIQRHPMWSNFEIPNKTFEKDNIHFANIGDLQLLHGIDLSKYKISNKRQLLRNCVNKELGKWVFDASKR